MHAQGHRPIDDIRQILWCFDRINEARKREASLDEEVPEDALPGSETWPRFLLSRAQDIVEEARQSSGGW